MEEEIVRIQVVPVGAPKKTKSDLVLTDARVYGVIDKGIFGHEQVSIPIHSIDSVFFGWIRHKPLLIVGAIAAFVGLMLCLVRLGASNPQQASSFLSLGLMCLFLGVVFLLVFWFLRPRTLLVNSGNFSVGGRPKSAEEAQGFVDALCAKISAASPSGEVPPPLMAN